MEAEARRIMYLRPAGLYSKVKDSQGYVGYKMNPEF
jgi:hypothetical protein